ncbi:hypothetical protein ACVINX_001178 [Bradyrhizobium diazoefficiens]
MARRKSLGARDSDCEIDDVLERRRRVLRAGGRRLHDLEESSIFVDQRLDVGVEIGRRNLELVGLADPRRHGVGEILVSTDDRDACQIERLSRQVRQRLLRRDLSAPLGKDGFEIAERAIVGGERLRLPRRERLCLARRERREDQPKHRQGCGGVTSSSHGGFPCAGDSSIMGS